MHSINKELRLWVVGILLLGLTGACSETKEDEDFKVAMSLKQQILFSKQGDLSCKKKEVNYTIITPLDACGCREYVLEYAREKEGSVPVDYIYLSQSRSDYYVYLKDVSYCHGVDSSRLFRKAELLSDYPTVIDHRAGTIYPVKADDLPTFLAGIEG